MTREYIFFLLSKSADGTVLSFNGVDYIKLSDKIIEEVESGTKYYKGFDF